MKTIQAPFLESRSHAIRKADLTELWFDRTRNQGTIHKKKENLVLTLCLPTLPETCGKDPEKFVVKEEMQDDED